MWLDQWESDYRTVLDENMQQSAYDDRPLKNIKHANRIGVSVDDNKIPDISCLNAPISQKEVEIAVKRLKLRKAAGIDNIPAEVLKYSACMLHKMIAFCFENVDSPIQWKQGIINPIVKPNSTDYRLPLTYRGITLLPVPCKANCDINNHHFGNWLEDSELLVGEQCGIRRNRCCLDHIYSLYSVINDSKLSCLSTFSCFIDLKKAFDNVNRDCLRYKLQQYGINGKLLHAVKSLYDNTACTVRVNHNFTSVFPVSCRVKQVV